MVVSFFPVNLDCHAPTSPPLPKRGVDNLLHNNGVVNPFLPEDECGQVLRLFFYTFVVLS